LFADTMERMLGPRKVLKVVPGWRIRWMRNASLVLYHRAN